MRPSLIHDALASRVTDNCRLAASCDTGAGNLQPDGLIGRLTRRNRRNGHFTPDTPRDIPLHFSGAVNIFAFVGVCA